MNLNSRVLMLGGPKELAKKYGVDFAGDINHVEASKQSYEVLIFSKSTDLGQVHKILNSSGEAKTHPEIIIVDKDLTAADISAASLCGRVFALVDAWDSPELEMQIFAAIESRQQGAQSAQFSSLVENEHHLLKSSTEKLSESLVDKEKKLERAQRRVAIVNRQTDALHRALVAIHMANTVGEVESLLNEAMNESLELAWVRIFFQWHDHIEAQISRVPELKIIKAPLLIGSRNLGQIVFARNKSGFTRSEDDFLQQVAEGVALAVDRLQKLDLAEDLKHEWESTFDSISEPLCLTDEKFVILKTNKAFSQETGREYKDLIGANCFDCFMGKDHPSQVIDSGNFKIERYKKGQAESKIFLVSTQRIQAKEKDPNLLLILFRNITEQQKLEKRMFESAKMAELGTVGSSIAHELNNPLGGIISFLQLIKMDCPEGDPYRADIIEMEKAGVRCKEIVENLLGYTRLPDSGFVSEYNLPEVLGQAMRIVELKSRSLGIQINLQKDREEIWLHGHPGLMSQAFGHILQVSIESISRKRSTDLRFMGEINISIQYSDAEIIIEIVDNGEGGPARGTTLAEQIITEHEGQLEIFSQPKMGTRAKVALKNV